MLLVQIEMGLKDVVSILTDDRHVAGVAREAHCLRDSRTVRSRVSIKTPLLSAHQADETFLAEASAWNTLGALSRLRLYIVSLAPHHADELCCDCWH